MGGALSLAVLAELVVGLAVFEERRTRLTDAVSICEGLEGRDDLMPNYHHLWWAHDMVFVNGRTGTLAEFGDRVCKSRGNWSSICSLDTDEDGFTNGQELGDPCCRWSPAEKGAFSLAKRQEYRRWGLSHPGTERDNPRRFKTSLAPASCADVDSNYDAAAYAQQFDAFYFNRADGEFEPTDLNPAKVISLLILLALLGHWAWKKDLCADIAPWASSRPHLSARTSSMVMLASFLYMDLVSGIVHLILDYAPHWLPVLGGLARGFQYHHHDPTAIVRISWYAYVSHVHLLCPVVAALLVLSDASRVQRLFWFWGAVFVHLFQTTHRWAHFRPDQLPWPVQVWQQSGLLLTKERHMGHHEDLESQFTILSGHTDFLLDAAVKLVPPIRYDVWLFVGIAWFLLPIGLDVSFRRSFEALEITKYTRHSVAPSDRQKDIDL
jgi:hypothetical protein